MKKFFVNVKQEVLTVKSSQTRAILVPILSVLLGLIVGAIIMVAFNYNPIVGYQALFDGAFGTPFNFGQSIRAATPLIFTGLGFAVAYTAGFFNIGLSGQALCGWLVSVTIGLAWPEGPSYLVLPLAILGGAVAGALWAAIAGILKAYFNTSEVITTIMLNYTIVYISDYMVRNILTPRADATPKVGPNASLRLDFLTEWTNGSTLHGGIFLALITVIVVYILMNKTTIGFELKSVGLNKHAAQYAGMNSKRNIILSMVISGFLAGLGGVMNGLGEFGNIFLLNGVAPAIGFDGMAVALLGGLNPFGTVLAAILFGGLNTGSSLMPLAAQIPSEVVDIVTAIIIFFVGSSYVITYFMDKRQHLPVGNQTVVKKGDEQA